MDPKGADGMANCVVLDQTSPGSALYAWTYLSPILFLEFYGIVLKKFFHVMKRRA